MNNRITNFIKKTSNRSLGIYILVAIVLDQFLNRWLGDLIVDAFPSTERGILAGIGFVEKLSVALEISFTLAFILIIYKVVRKKS